MDLHATPTTDVAGVVMASPDGKLLLQRRDDNPAISSPNMIGMFGGHLEAGEDHMTCALREVEEETGLALCASELDLIVSTRVQYGNGVVRAGTFYFATNINPAQFVVTEGALIAIPFEEIGRYFHEMVPTSAYVVSLITEEVRNGQRLISAADAR